MTWRQSRNGTNEKTKQWWWGRLHRMAWNGVLLCSALFAQSFDGTILNPLRPNLQLSCLLNIKWQCTWVILWNTCQQLGTLCLGTVRKLIGNCSHCPERRLRDIFDTIGSFSQVRLTDLPYLMRRREACNFTQSLKFDCAPWEWPGETESRPTYCQNTARLAAESTSVITVCSLRTSKTSAHLHLWC